MLSSIESAKLAAEAEGATVFIGISHLGLTDADKTNRSTYVADNCPWFAAIIDGHSHTVLPAGMVRSNGVLIAQTGEYGNNIGVTEIAIDATGVTGAAASLISIKGNESSCGITPDAQVQNHIDGVNARNDAYVNAVVFTVPVQLLGERQYVRTQETNLGNFIADAMRAKTGTDVALASGASLRSNLGPGTVTRGELQTALLAETELARIEITGADLFRILEGGLGTYPAEYFLFPHISGIRVVFSEDNPAGSRVTYAALLDGTRIEAAKTYSCTVRHDIVGAYLDGIGDPAAGVDYFLGYGMQSDAVIAYATSGITIPDSIDGRLKVRGTTYGVSFDGNGAESGSL